MRYLHLGSEQTENHQNIMQVVAKHIIYFQHSNNEPCWVLEEESYLQLGQNMHPFIQPFFKANHYSFAKGGGEKGENVLGISLNGWLNLLGQIFRILEMKREDPVRVTNWARRIKEGLGVLRWVIQCRAMSNICSFSDPMKYSMFYQTWASKHYLHMLIFTYNKSLFWRKIKMELRRVSVCSEHVKLLSDFQKTQKAKSPFLITAFVTSLT